MTSARLPDGQGLASTARRELRRFTATLPDALGGGSFSLTLPASWQPQPVPLAAAMPAAGAAAKLIALYGGPEANLFTPFAQVQFARLTRDISAADWLRFYLDRVRYVLREIDVVSDNMSEALVGLQIGARVAAARVAVRLYGPLAFIVVAGAPAELYEHFKDMLGLAVRDFELSGQMPQGHVEEWPLVSMPGGPQLRIPVSWEVKPISGGDGQRGEIDASNHDAAGVWVGQTRVRWVTATFPGSDAAEAKKMMQEFGQAGIALGTTIATSTDHTTTGMYIMTANAVRLATIEGNPRTFEFWQVAMCGPSYRILLAMLTPSRTESFYWWAVNRRALAIMASTLQ